MKTLSLKRVTNFLVVISFNLWCISSNAQGIWQTLGNAGFSPGTADYISLAINSNGVPYVAFKDWNNGSKVTVMKLKADSSAWEVVGNAGFSSGQADYVSLAFNNNATPYVAFCDYNNMQRVSVMKLNTAGTAWEYVGSAGFSSNYAKYISLAINNSGVPYVAFTDMFNDNKTTVMKYNASNSTWEVVGTAGFTAGGTKDNSLVINSSGVPYVAYRDLAYSQKASVMKLNAAGTGWEVVGTLGFSDGLAEHTSLAIDGNGIPYVAYKDYGNNFKATVMKLNAAGTGWEVVGTAGFSAGSATHVTIAINSSNVPYVIYGDGGNNFKATVMKLNAAGTGWEIVGNAGFSSGSVNYTTIAFNSNDKPVVAFQDAGNSYKATAKHLVPVTVYSITYHTDGGTHTNPATFTVNDLPLTLSPATKAGYTFDGWYDNAAFSGSPITQITTIGNKELWAKFSTSTSITQYNSNNLNIYPNPCDGIFTLFTSKIVNSIQVTDVLGREVLKIKPDSEKTNINLSSQPEGLYFIKVISSNEQYIQRLIIKH